MKTSKQQVQNIITEMVRKEVATLTEVDHAAMARAAQLMDVIKASQLTNKLSVITSPAAKYYLITSFAELLGIPKTEFHGTINQYKNYLGKAVAPTQPEK